MESSSGVGDAVNVVMPGYEERLAEERKQREVMRASITPCPHCGTQRKPQKSWEGFFKPIIFCPNHMCPVRPRTVATDQW